MKRFRLSPEAADDITEIWDFIAQDDSDAAERVRRDIYDTIKGLVEMPQKGHTREDLTEAPVLFWPVRSYLIIYRPKTDPLEVVGVLHGARDVPNLLRRR